MSDMFAADVRFECSTENDVVEFKVRVANLPPEVLLQLIKNMDDTSAAIIKAIFEGSGAGELLHTIEQSKTNGFKHKGQVH